MCIITREKFQAAYSDFQRKYLYIMHPYSSRFFKIVQIFITGEHMES
jgi:hypothetical protein